MLDLILLVLPLLVLCVAYILITRTLYVGMVVGKDVRTLPASSGSAQTMATAAISATPGSSSCVLVLNVTADYNGKWVGIFYLALSLPHSRSPA